MVEPLAISSMYFCSNNRYSIIRIYSLAKNSLFCATRPILFSFTLADGDELLTRVETREGISSNWPARTCWRKFVTIGSSMGTLDT